MTEQQDSSGALEEVLSRFRVMVRSVAARHALRDEDLDALVQEVRIRLWRGRDTGEEIRALPTSYVYRTAMSAAIDLVRQRRGRDIRFVDDGDSVLTQRPASRTAGEDAELLELAQRVEKILGAMIASRRVVVRMSLTGYTRSEIADRLGWTDSKVRNLLSRGMEELRARLSDDVRGDARAERINEMGTHD